MQAYIGDFADFYKQACEFKKNECITEITTLKNEVISLSNKKEIWEVQVFMLRKFGIRLKQKEVPIIFEKILDGLES